MIHTTKKNPITGIYKITSPSGKICNKCNLDKPLSEFHKDKYSPDGISYKCKECKKEYFQQNKEQYRKRTKDWKFNNLEKWRYQDNLRQKKRRKKYPHLRKWSCLLENTLKRLGQIKKESTQTTLGYSALELKKYLDKLGMKWGYDQIDHKIPVTWFKSDTPPSIVNDLRNLQPLDEISNKEKSNSFMSVVDKEYFILVKPWIKENYL